jgi:hypothetical protein
MQGRVLAEALQEQQKLVMPTAATRSIKSPGAYCAEIEVSSIGRRSYLNYGRRCAAPLGQTIGFRKTAEAQAEYSSAD